VHPLIAERSPSCFARFEVAAIASQPFLERAELFFARA
jgi:hypothetical protein